ncbi:MAG: U32 family peptidase [Clostridiales bacterium]|nr:U32 family peptidase [Clostridiales bacterium]
MKTELLAPAGGVESAYAAINNGADAIYLGLKDFSARSSAQNFEYEELLKLLGYAHSVGVKVFVAMNTLVKQSEVEGFLNSACKVWSLGVDAIIIQDLFLGKYLKEIRPDIVLHLSTQAGTCNAFGARLAKNFGFDRVILARETKLSEIKKIANIIETEVFIQGALCTCFSGQCYFSSFVGGNSGNRGKCKQPCRKKYSIMRKGFEEKSYKLSLSDLSVGEKIEDLIKAGVYSFKIEGRLRRPEYVAAAVYHYRSLLDGKNGDLSAVKRTFNRGNYTKGLAFGQDKSFISSAVQGHIGEFAGRIKVVSGKFICESNERFENGDCFKILRDGKEVGGGVYYSPCKGGFIISSKERLKNGDKAFITTDISLNKKLINTENKVKEVEISAEFEVGKLPKVVICGEEYFGEDVLLQASSRPLTKDEVIKNFNKTDIYPFKPKFSQIKIVGDSFLTASSLNALRRKVYSGYFNKISTQGREEKEINYISPTIKAVNNKKTAVICQNLNGVLADIGVLKPFDYNADFSQAIKDFSGEKFLYLPAYFTSEEIEALKDKIQDFDGLYCEGYFGVELCRAWGKKLFAGVGFNIANSVALSQINADYITLSKELSLSEIKPLCAENAFYLTAGDLKIMDLIYCPFEKSCKNCDKKQIYELFDENNRCFYINRYLASECRFEVYNCANLICENDLCGKLFDFSTQQDINGLILSEKQATLKEKFTKYTKGHSQNTVL